MLDFHHIDPKIKTKTVARMTSNSTSNIKIEAEIDKCIVLCANCHREFHFLNRKLSISILEYVNNKVTITD